MCWSHWLPENKDAVETSPEERGQKRIRAWTEAGQHIRHGAFQILYGLRAAIDRLKGVDQYDLPIEPGKMLAEERLYDNGFVGLVTPLHHRPE